jgi:integrase
VIPLAGEPWRYRRRGIGRPLESVPGFATGGGIERWSRARPLPCPRTVWKSNASHGRRGRQRHQRIGLDAIRGGSSGGMIAMKRKAWVSQLKRHVEQYGADGAAWYCNWYDPDGKLRTMSCGTGPRGKAAAEARANKTHYELTAGTYESPTGKTWEAFRKRYEQKVIATMEARSAELARRSLDTFERIIKPKRISRIRSEDISDFIAKRKTETVSTERRLSARGAAGKVDTVAEAKSAKISAATLNKALRYLKAALRTAVEWGDLKKMPRVRFQREPKRLATYVTPEHFAAIYAACESVQSPTDIRNVAPCDWWRALLIATYLTGWRIGQILELRWSDIDLEAGMAVTRAEGNKGRRDMQIPVHPMMVEHLRRIRASFSDVVFPWPHGRRRLWTVFDGIQSRAVLADGSPLPPSGKGGRWYGFHDLRRAFASLNAGSMNVFELQQLMQHKSLATTQTYVNLANQLNPKVANLFVPPLPATKAHGAG